jgi:hypothetical protein
MYSEYIERGPCYFVVVLFIPFTPSTDTVTMVTPFPLSWSLFSLCSMQGWPFLANMVAGRCTYVLYDRKKVWCFCPLFLFDGMW